MLTGTVAVARAPNHTRGDSVGDQGADLGAPGEAGDGAGRAAEAGQVSAVTDRLITAVAFFFYVVVFASVAAMSYRGLMAFAADTLRLSGGWRYVVPISLDGAAVSASFFGYRASIHGEPAFGPRMLVCLFGGASAFFNGHEAAAERGPLAAAFYAAMSVLVVLMFDLGAKQIRRRALARQGKLEAPLPRFRLARWLLAPVETFCALRIAALESDLTAEQAVRLARTRRTAAKPASIGPASTEPASMEPGAIEPAGPAQPPTAAAATESLTASSHARRAHAGPAVSVDGGGRDPGPAVTIPHALDRLVEPEPEPERLDPGGGTGDGDPEDGDPGVDAAGRAGGDSEEGRISGGQRGTGQRDAGQRGSGAEARVTVLAMLQSAVSAGLPLTGREVSDRVGCHVGEGRKLLREARLQHLQGQLADAARRGTEVTAEDVMALYQVRVDHAGRLLTDARRGAPRGRRLPAAPADDPPGRGDEDGGARRRLVAAS